MRSLQGAVFILGLVAVLSFVLVAFVSRGEVVGDESWMSRKLLAFAPIRKNGAREEKAHRHGRVDFRYQLVDCEGQTTIPVSSTTAAPTTTVPVTTVPVTTVPTAAPTTTVPVTTVPTSTTTTTIPTTPGTTTPAPPECPIECPTSPDPCFPIECVLEDNIWFCKTIPVICNDQNPCTLDQCNSETGQCDYIFVPERTNCSCVTRDPPCPVGTPCNPGFCIDNNRTELPICITLGPEEVCNDQQFCTDDFCLEGNQTIPNPNCNYTVFDDYRCANCYNPAIPGCEGGGLGPGQIVGIVAGAVSAAVIAASLAAFARKRQTGAAGSTGAGQTPVANTSPIYRDPVNAGVMPEGLN